MNLIHQLYLFSIGVERISFDVKFHLWGILSLDNLNSFPSNVTFRIGIIPVAALQVSKNDLGYLIVSFYLDTCME